MTFEQERARWRGLVSAGLLSFALSAVATVSAAQSPSRLSDAGALLEEVGKQAQDRSQPEAERLKLIEALGRWGTEQVRTPLLALLSDPLASIRAAAARALGWPGNREAVAALRQRVEAPAEAPAVRAAALEALGGIGDDSARALVLSASRDPDAKVREAALQGVTFGRLVSPADRVPLMRQLAGDPDLDLLLRCQAIRALGELKDEGATDLLIRLIEHEPSSPMPRLPNPSDQPQIMMVRYREVRDVRAWAARVLGALDAKSALPVLLKTAEDPDDFFLRLMSIEALGPWKAREALPALVRRLDDPFDYARVAALRGLAEIGDRSVVDAVLGRLDDEIPTVRAQAVYTLGVLGDPKVRPQLETLQDRETNSDVQQVLAATLARLAR